MQNSRGSFRKIKLNKEDIERAIIAHLSNQVDDTVVFPEDYRTEFTYRSDGLNCDLIGVVFTLFYENT